MNVEHIKDRSAHQRAKDELADDLNALRARLKAHDIGEARDRRADARSDA